MDEGNSGERQRLPVGWILGSGAQRGAIVGALSGPALLLLYLAGLTLITLFPSFVLGDGLSFTDVGAFFSTAGFVLVVAGLPAAFIGLAVGAVVGLGSSGASLGAVLLQRSWRLSRPVSAGTIATGKESWRVSALTSALGGSIGGTGTAAVILSQLSYKDIPGIWPIVLTWVAVFSAILAPRAMAAAIAAEPADSDPPTDSDAPTGSHPETDSLAELRDAVPQAPPPATPATPASRLAGLGWTLVALGSVPAFMAWIAAAIAGIRVGFSDFASDCGRWTFGYGEDADTVRYNYASGLFPPQATCVYEDGTVVELVTRQYMVTVAVLCVVAVLLLALGLVMVLRARRAMLNAAKVVDGVAAGTTGDATTGDPDARTRAIAGLVSRLAVMAALLISLMLAITHVVGAEATIPEFDPTASNLIDNGYLPPTQADPYAPTFPDDGGTTSPVEPAPVEPVTPSPIPPLPTNFTQDELRSAMQELVDSTMDTAGPIDDQSIPAGTRFTPTENVCFSGDETGMQLGLEVGFNTVDDAAGLERVRALWAADGYELHDRTVNAKGDELDPTTRVDATGAGDLPGGSLVLRLYDDYLILTVQSICLGAP
ncbi:MAG: hypothetical protein JWQ43_3853 [Glaciihabitans sp.]|nr:hypothetical protein [Glaciihabitans sp.]